MRKIPAIPRIEWDEISTPPDEVQAQQDAYSRLTHGKPDCHPTNDEIIQAMAETEADLYDGSKKLSLEATREIMNILRSHAEELGETL